MISNPRGFNLLELVIVIAILSVISAIGARVLQAGFNAYFVNESVTRANQEARLAMTRMVQDITAIGAPSLITTATANTLSFTDVSGNTITYQRQGTQLLRNNQVLASDVSTLNFVYLDANGAVTTTLQNIRYVYITLGFSSDQINYQIATTVYVLNGGSS